MAAGPVILDAVPDLFCKIQPFSILFEHLHDTHTLKIVGKPIGTKLIQDPLSGVSKGRMPQIVSEGNGFCQIFV